MFFKKLSDITLKKSADILITSRSGYRKIVQPIRIMSGLARRKRKLNQLIQFRLTSTKVIFIQRT